MTAVLLCAGCRHGPAREPTAEPAEVEIDWPDAGAGYPEQPEAPETPETPAKSPGESPAE